MSKVRYIQVINFNLEGITRDDFMGVANEVAPNFAQLPGLISKAWLSDEANILTVVCITGRVKKLVHPIEAVNSTLRP